MALDVCPLVFMVSIAAHSVFYSSGGSYRSPACCYFRPFSAISTADIAAANDDYVGALL